MLRSVPVNAGEIGHRVLLEVVTKNIIFILVFLGGLFLLAYSIQQYLFPQVVIEWTTASELDTVGFNILRADGQDKDPVKVNEHLIEPAADPLMGGSYQYSDTTVQPGITYYYYLEDIDAQGNSSRNGPQVVTASQTGLLEGGLAIVLCITAVIGFFRTRQQVTHA